MDAGASVAVGGPSEANSGPPSRSLMERWKTVLLLPALLHDSLPSPGSRRRVYFLNWGFGCHHDALRLKDQSLWDIMGPNGGRLLRNDRRVFAMNRLIVELSPEVNAVLVSQAEAQGKTTAGHACDLIESGIRRSTEKFVLGPNSSGCGEGRRCCATVVVSPAPIGAKPVPRPKTAREILEAAGMVRLWAMN